MSEPPALDLRALDVAYRVRGRILPVLRGLSLEVARGEAYGLVGESGCGKSTAALAVMRYLPPNGQVTGGRIAIGGRDVAALSPVELRRLRAHGVAMVYQDPGKALNPSLRIGRQLGEVFALRGASPAEAAAQALAMLRRVRIVDPAAVLRRYPHELSGGMQQRVCIAAALATDPALLILDEPTTGLDATVEAEVLDLVSALRRETGTAILLISHNLGIVARLCDRVGVLYAGELVEEGTPGRIFATPAHPYTAALLRCLPREGRRKNRDRLETIPGFLPSPGSVPPGCAFAPRCALVAARCRREPPALAPFADRLVRCHHAGQTPDAPQHAEAEPAQGIEAERTGPPLLSVRNLARTFGSRALPVRALRDLSFDLWPGETLGLVGESGSGKSTFAKALLGIVPADRGATLQLTGRTLPPNLDDRDMEAVKGLQIVFQNADSALNRAHPVRRILGRALQRLAGLAGAARATRTAALARAVRLAEHQLDARPRQLSGGQKQRVAIARAFAGQPRLVVCDEPTSALDVSVQAAILNLLADLQARHATSYVLISHDIGVVRYLADRIAVLYLGQLMEIGPAERVLAGPHHPYTAALLSAAPSLDGASQERIRLQGEMPSALAPPSGCVFHTRCHRRIAGRCETLEPALADIGAGHLVRCHLQRTELDVAQATRPKGEAFMGQQDSEPTPRHG